MASWVMGHSSGSLVAIRWSGTRTRCTPDRPRTPAGPALSPRPCPLQGPGLVQMCFPAIREDHDRVGPGQRAAIDRRGPGGCAVRVARPPERVLIQTINELRVRLGAIQRLELG